MLCISKLANATLTSQEGYDLFLPPSLIEVAVLVHGKDFISSFSQSSSYVKGEGSIIKDTFSRV